MSDGLNELIKLPGNYSLHLSRSKDKPWDLWVTLIDPEGDDLLNTKCEDEDESRYRAFAANMTSRSEK